MKVFVTGGTGAIGRYAVPALVAAGHRVSALARCDEKARALKEQGAEPVSVSLFDRDALAEAFAGHDAVVNLASALPSTTRFVLRSAWRDCDRVRITGSANVVNAALRVGVQRLIQESVSMLYADGGSDWITETHPVDHYPISRGNHAAEASARRFADAGGSATVLRFGVFCGRGAAHSEEMLRMARMHVGFSAGPPDSYLSSIHVADAARAVVAAVDRSVDAGAFDVFNVVDDRPLTKRQYAQACTAAVGTRRYVRAPGRLGLLLGDRLTSLTRSLRVSNRLFRAAADWRPEYPSAFEGFAATASAEGAG